jgi:hypothetical protein
MLIHWSLRFLSSRLQLFAPCAICFPLAVLHYIVRYTSEHRVFLYDTCVKYGSVGKCRQKFRRKFYYERVPRRQTIHNLMNKLRRVGLLIDKKQKRKHRVLTEKLGDIGARCEHATRKRLAHEIECQTLVQEWQDSCWSHSRKLVYGVL